jgi:hypothetical protein
VGNIPTESLSFKVDVFDGPIGSCQSLGKVGTIGGDCKYSTTSRYDVSAGSLRTSVEDNDIYDHGKIESSNQSRVETYLPEGRSPMVIFLPFS